MLIPRKVAKALYQGSENTGVSLTGRLSKGWEGLELEPLCSSHRAAIRATLLVTFFVPGFILLSW